MDEPLGPKPQDEGVMVRVIRRVDYPDAFIEIIATKPDGTTWRVRNVPPHIAHIIELDWLIEDGTFYGIREFDVRDDPILGADLPPA